VVAQSVNWLLSAARLCTVWLCWRKHNSVENTMWAYFGASILPSRWAEYASSHTHIYTLIIAYLLTFGPPRFCPWSWLLYFQSSAFASNLGMDNVFSSRTDW